MLPITALINIDQLKTGNVDLKFPFANLAVACQNTILPCIFVKFYSRWCPPRLIGSDVCPRSKIRFHVTTGKTKVYEIINYG